MRIMVWGADVCASELGDEEGVGLYQARAGAISRDGSVRAVRFGPRRLDAEAAGPRRAPDAASEAAAVPSDALRGADGVDLCRHQRLSRCRRGRRRVAL